ncbi:MAG: CRISPR-associated endonuclease Cas1 [Pseudomonadota bacterium]
MGMLLIDRKDIELRQERGTLLVYERGRRSGSVPLRQLDRVVIQNRARLDTGLLGVLAEHGVGLIVLNPRFQKRTATLPAAKHGDVTRRINQYRRSLDEVWRCHWSRMLVSRKIRAQLRVLTYALEQRPDQRRVLIKALRELELRLAGVRVEQELGRDSIRGIEGAAAAAYFRALSGLFPESLGFKGRNRRPPRDPVNACLSLSYTLLHSEAVMASYAAGLEPLLGFYHDPAYGRDSLASDLIEPLRPKVDAWVWQLFRVRELREEHFARDKGACLLIKTGRKHFYSAWAQTAPVLQRRLRRYTALLARSLEHEDGSKRAKV